MDQDENPMYQNQPISFKDIVEVFKSYFQETIKNILWIILITIPIVCYFGYKQFTTPILYSDKLTFMVNDEDGNSISSVASILGQIGIGGSGGRSRHNLQKITELSKTRNIVGKVLLDSCVFEDQNDLFINHLLKIYKWDEKWAEKTPSLAGFRFSQPELGDFSKQEKGIFKIIYQKVIGSPKRKGIFSSGYSDETGIMRLQATSINEAITALILNKSYKALSSYYIDKSTEKQKETFELVNAKKDSIFGALQSAEYSLVNFKETNHNLIDRRSRMSEIRLNREVLILTQAYGEAIKNVEISDFTLKNTTPYVQLIDAPLLPISPEKPSLIFSLLKGGILGLFLALIFIWFRKFYRDALSD